MLYYDRISETPRKISPKEFMKKFGKKYSEFDTKIKFSDAHCIIDPYVHEIHDKIVPLINTSYENLHDDYRNSCDEI